MNKIEKRNMFQKIFGEKQVAQNGNSNNTYQAVRMLNSYTSKIYSFNGNIYDDDTVRSTIDAIARHFAKMKPTHKLKNHEQNGNLSKLLNVRPNPEMSTYDFLYKTVTALYLDNNAYIYIKRDELGNVIALYPILYNDAELLKDKDNNLYLRFTFNSRETVTESIENIIILRKHFYKDFFGELNSKPLNPLINLLYTINQGFINAVKSSAFIRGILKVTGMLQDDDKKELTNSFKDQFFSSQNNGGVVVSDDKSEYIPIESKPVIIDDKNTALAKEKIYSYFGVCEGIVKGRYTDTEFQAFYESVLEPLAIQFSQEFSAKLFTQRELDFGNTIVFVADRLSYMSTQSKVSMFNAIKELGVISKGQIAEIFNLAVPPDADEYLQSLNYIDRKIANEYQLAKTQGEGQGQTQGGEPTNE